MVNSKKNIISQLRPAAKNLQTIATGEMNDMIIVDHKEVFRFPRTDQSRQRLVYESRVLAKLENKLSMPIPRLIELDNKKEYSILSYIKGEVLQEADIQDFPEAERYDLASTLAVFMRELNAHLSVMELDTWTDKLMPVSDSWDQYYASVASSEHKNIYKERYRRQYKKIVNMQASSPRVPTIAIHGDLHAGNMLFRDGKLSGVIDFGDCETGTIYNELRPLFNSFGIEFIQRTVSELDGALGDVNVELVREMAIMHELSVLARSDSKTLKESSRVATARRLLDLWFGDKQVDKQEVKAVIFDCFGVLTSEQWIPFRRKHFHTDDARQFAQRMMNALVTGKIAPQEFVTTIADESNVDEDDVRESLSGSLPDNDLFTWISEHKDNYRISMLSNAGSNMLGSLFNKEQIALFDDIVLSFEVGLAKPDPAIFRLAAERLSLKPEECLFVDDKISFCNAAERIGMKSIHYSNYQDYLLKFQQLGQ